MIETHAMRGQRRSGERDLSPNTVQSFAAVIFAQRILTGLDRPSVYGRESFLPSLTSRIIFYKFVTTYFSSHRFIVCLLTHYVLLYSTSYPFLQQPTSSRLSKTSQKAAEESTHTPARTHAPARTCEGPDLLNQLISVCEIHLLSG